MNQGGRGGKHEVPLVSKSIYVRNLDDSISEQMLLNLFSAFGEIVHGKIMVGVVSKERFAFLGYNSPKHAANALTMMNGAVWGAKKLEVSMALNDSFTTCVNASTQTQPDGPNTSSESGCAAKALPFLTKGHDLPPLSIPALVRATPTEQREMVRERLYPRIKQLYPGLADKVTGMLLEMDVSELLLMLEEQEYLTIMVEDAVRILRNHPDYF